MSDLKTKQWFIKIYHKGQLIEVREVWSDSEYQACMFAHKQAVSSLETQMETPTETERRMAENLLLTLEREAENLSEFIYDDYGNTVDQLGMEETAKLEQKLRQLRNEISEVVTRLA